MNDINAASSPCGSTEGSPGSDCSSPRARTPPPPPKRLVGRIKPVTSPRTSMKLLALQHLANVYANKQAAAIAKKVPKKTKDIPEDDEDERHSIVSSPPPNSENIPLSPMALPRTMKTSRNQNANKNARGLEETLELPFDPQGGAAVRTFIENGTGGTYQLFH